MATTNRVYAWETDYEKSWELLKEDASGFMQKSINQILEKSKVASLKKALGSDGSQRLSMMRHIFFIIDLSDAMKNDQSEAGTDYKPTLSIFCLRTVKQFVEQYFDLNPIGQLGIIITRNKRADKLTELCGHPGKHLRAIDRLITACSLVSGTSTATTDNPTEDEDALAAALGPSGEASLQNALLLATRTLSKVPKHTSREVLAIFASLSTCDPGDIHETIETCVQANVTCSLISLTAEVYIYRTLCKLTGGIFCVAIDGSHLKRILLEGASMVGDKNKSDHQNSYLTSGGGGNFLHPPPCATQSEATLVRVGFPRYQTNDGVDHGEGNSATSISACACHIDDPDAEAPFPFTQRGYICPICRSKYCEVPTECRLCDLTLVSAPHLARSYGHLFPPQEFLPIVDEDLASTRGEEGIVLPPPTPPFYTCKACFFQIGEDSTPYKCVKCDCTFCIDCTLFVHGTLHACPGCAFIHVTMDQGK